MLNRFPIRGVIFLLDGERLISAARGVYSLGLWMNIAFFVSGV